MSQDEFFAFMPLLLYGIAVSELIMHWRDYMKTDRRYWPHLLTGIILLELAFVNFYYLYDELNELFLNYPTFLLRLSGPLVFLLTVSVYTPENKSNIKTYFNDKAPLIFTLLATYIFINLLNDLNNNVLTAVRLTAILICLLVATTKKFWLIWSWVIVRVILFITQEYYPHLIT